jgi:ribosomal protein L27
MSTRKLSAGIVAALMVGVLVMASMAVASGAATTVSIKAQQGGFFGYVHSDKQKCEAGRKVVLYKQKGTEQKPTQDTKIGHDFAQPNGPDSQWSINTNKSGRFYAKAVETSSCHKAFSKTVHSQ